MSAAQSRMNERDACELLAQARLLVHSRHSPDGYNIGVNVGVAAWPMAPIACSAGSGKVPRSAITIRGMNDPRESALRSLKRLLANGLLTGLPRRPADQDLLVALAASRIAPGRSYLESEVNELLESWLASISAPFGIDHVTLRRMLVDARFLERTTSGSTYRINAVKIGEMESLRDIEPADVLAEIRSDRDMRKKRHA
jgi:hypothetical protein